MALQQKRVARPQVTATGSADNESITRTAIDSVAGLDLRVQADRPIAFLSREQVCMQTSLSGSQLKRLVGANDFPQPVSISKRRVAWIAAEIEKWCRQRIAESRDQIETRRETDV